MAKKGHATSTTWKPGQSGNPSGKPKPLSADYKEAIASMVPRALERLKELIEDKNAAVAKAACTEVLDRVHGKAVQTVNGSNHVQIEREVVVNWHVDSTSETKPTSPDNVVSIPRSSESGSGTLPS